MNYKILNIDYKYKPVQTKRLLLIKPDLKYKKELLGLYKDKRVWIYNGAGDNKYSPKRIEKQITKDIQLWKNKKKVSFFIIFNNEFIGTIGLHNVSKDFRNAQVGFMICPKYWSNGFMSEVLPVFIKFIFKNTILFRISAFVCTKNKGSITVLEKNGFKKEGLLKKSSIFNNKVYDNYIYALINKKKAKI